MRWLIYAHVTATLGLAASASALAAGGLIPKESRPRTVDTLDEVGFDFLDGVAAQKKK